MFKHCVVYNMLYAIRLYCIHTVHIYNRLIIYFPTCFPVYSSPPPAAASACAPHSSPPHSCPPTGTPVRPSITTVI